MKVLNPTFPISVEAQHLILTRLFIPDVLCVYTRVSIHSPISVLVDRMVMGAAERAA